MCVKATGLWGRQGGRGRRPSAGGGREGHRGQTGSNALVHTLGILEGGAYVIFWGDHWSHDTPLKIETHNKWRNPSEVTAEPVDRHKIMLMMMSLIYLIKVYDFLFLVEMF